MKRYEQYTEDFLREVLINSRTFGECCDKLGYARNSRNNNIIREISNRYDIDISHFGLYTNIKGKTFGRLTALEFDKKYTQEKGSNSAYWKCRCECGKIVQVPFNNLNSGHTQSCGCLARDNTSKVRRLNLDNQRFGKLIVLGIDEEKTKAYHRVYRLCRCDCGNIISVHTDALTRKNGVKSCGCEKSKGELRIKEVLNKLNISYVSQWTTPSLKRNRVLRCDFAIKNNGKVTHIIEFNGEQHYIVYDFFGGEERLQKQKERDALKQNYCKENNIKLIEIPYWDYDKINEQYILDLIK